MQSVNPQVLAKLNKKYISAMQALKAGLYTQAELLFKEILSVAPNEFNVHQQLGMLYASRGKPTQALIHFGVIAQHNPQYAIGFANLANALSDSGQLLEAIAHYEKALALDDSLLMARLAYAHTLSKAEHYEDALTQYKLVLDTDKRNHIAFNGAGVVFKTLEDLPKALDCFENAVEICPSNPDYRMHFALTLSEAGFDDIAAKHLLEALKLKPDWLDGVVSLSELMSKQRRFDEAIECINRGMQLKPKTAELYERRADVYIELADAQHAKSDYEMAMKLKPNNWYAKLGLSKSLLALGDTNAAEQTIMELIKVNPDNPAYYSQLATTKKFIFEDPIIEKFSQIVKNLDDSESIVYANNALGKMYDDSKQWDLAFEHYAISKQEKNRNYQYNADKHSDYVNRIIEVFSAELFNQFKGLGDADSTPVIIVGMPRSGTTLTEQIVSSHPNVMPAGEVSFWSFSKSALPISLKTKTFYPDCVKELSKDVIDEVANRYLALLNKIAGPEHQAKHITDKFPHNFMNLGLIALIFPNAPIIHCKRDAMDNCLSIFFQNFNDAHEYACDLTNLGKHHNDYERLMSHWHNVLPNRIFDIQYEDTIADPEYWSRKLIAHIGLEWDDACLAPHKLERTVRTASHWQVRQPIYKTSVQRWKNYEKHLQPLKDVLTYR